MLCKNNEMFEHKQTMLSSNVPLKQGAALLDRISTGLFNVFLENLLDPKHTLKYISFHKRRSGSI